MSWPFLPQVLDSYVAVKLNEALYEMKEQLQETERHVKSVIREKERLERTLQEKVQLIRVCLERELLPHIGIKRCYEAKESALCSTLHTLNTLCSTYRGLWGLVVVRLS